MVWKCFDTISKKEVVLKRILVENENEGFPITGLREIRILKRIDHVNIVKLIEVVHSKPEE